MAWLISRSDAGLPIYFSIKVGKDLGSPGGGWSQDVALAVQFARETDAEDFMNTYQRQFKEFCEVVKR